MWTAAKHIKFHVYSVDGWSMLHVAWKVCIQNLLETDGDWQILHVSSRVIQGKSLIDWKIANFALRNA